MKVDQILIAVLFLISIIEGSLRKMKRRRKNGKETEINSVILAMEEALNNNEWNTVEEIDKNAVLSKLKEYAKIFLDALKNEKYGDTYLNWQKKKADEDKLYFEKFFNANKKDMVQMNKAFSKLEKDEEIEKKGKIREAAETDMINKKKNLKVRIKNEMEDLVTEEVGKKLALKILENEMEREKKFLEFNSFEAERLKSGEIKIEYTEGYGILFDEAIGIYRKMEEAKNNKFLEDSARNEYQKTINWNQRAIDIENNYKNQMAEIVANNAKRPGKYKNWKNESENEKIFKIFKDTFEEAYSNAKAEYDKSKRIYQYSWENIDKWQETIKETIIKAIGERNLIIEIIKEILEPKNTTRKK